MHLLANPGRKSHLLVSILAHHSCGGESQLHPMSVLGKLQESVPEELFHS